MTKDAEVKTSKINLKSIRRGATGLAILAAAAYGVRAFLLSVDSLPVVAVGAGTVLITGFLLVSYLDK